jgi:TRAP-type C4-dicarboxylate transport system permease large subunit
MLIIFIQLVMLSLGTFMAKVFIMMITFPIFMPIIKTIGFSSILFGLLVLLSLEISLTSPPFVFPPLCDEGHSTAGHNHDGYLPGRPALHIL